MSDELVAIFPDPRSAARALDALRDEQVHDAQVATPAPFSAVHATASAPSGRLRRIALAGALTGLAGAVALQVVTSRSLGLVVGGKPIVSWTAFGVVMFELTMLLAGVANFAALVALCALERRRVSRAALEHVSSERIVVVVPAGRLDGERRAAVRASLLDGAAEVLG